MEYNPGQNANFNPTEVVYLEEKLGKNIDPVTDGASVKITDYRNEKITLEAIATGTNFLLLSEVYYPSWKAYVDGKETEIVKSNYFMRGIVLPAGKHKVEFKYESPKFETGKMASLATNSLVMIGLFITLFLLWKENEKKKKAETTEK
jgi:uncharacterized membrane protein YfhO